jgi:hypothetical protein
MIGQPLHLPVKAFGPPRTAGFACDPAELHAIVGNPKVSPAPRIAVVLMKFLRSNFFFILFFI